MKRITFLFLFLNILAFAQTPTWSDKIAKIIYNNCTECHRSGAIATFSLQSYADAKANAFGIKYATGSRNMPPWKADPSYNHLKGERVLTDQQIQDLSDWVSAGAPSGDLSLAPPAPTFPKGIKMLNPDKTVAIPTYSVSKNTDDYRCFTIPSGISVDKYLAQVEFEPMNLSIVHHILLFQDNASTCKNLDDADPLPGYSSYGGGVGSSTATLIGGWVPGGNLIDIPTGMGIRLKAGSYFILQIHYSPGSMTKKDSTRCHFKYSSLTAPREVFVASILNHANGVNGGLTNGPLYISANTVKSFNQRYDMDNSYDYSIIAVAPHMHMIGKTYKIYAITPLKDTLKLCLIPNWDFRWQGAYTFRKIVKFPKNTKIYGDASYDNTTNNIFNPNSPPKNVSLGENTSDEMMLCYFTFTVYKPGDENIILDSTLLAAGFNGTKYQQTTQLKIYPNPVNFTLNIDLAKNAAATVVLMDLNGRTLQSINVSTDHYALEVSGYSAGIYMLKIEQEGKIITKRFVKN